MTRAFPPSMLTRTLVLTTGLLLLGADLADARSAAPPPTRQVSRGERREAIEGANRAMAAEDWAAAARAWARVEALDADFADASYNRGVAQYRAGDFRGAAESFQRAARLGDADLAARAMYNEGTARYAEALATLEEDGAPMPADPSAAEMPPQDPLQDAIERVGRSLEHFRDAIDADPTSVDARANAELAHRLLRRLQEVRQQQQSQNGEGDEQQESEPQDGDGEQQQQQPSPPQDGEGEQQQSPPQDGEGEQQQQQQQSPPQDGEGEQQQQPQSSPPQDGEGEQQPSPPQDGEGDQEQQPSPSASQGDTESKASEAEATEGTGEVSAESSERLSREAAERLLQSVRDKERQRRREKARQAAQGPRAPVERDW